MASTRIVRGRMADSRHIELDEPIHDVKGPVEVFVRPAPVVPTNDAQDVFEFIKALPAGKRSKRDIDEQIREDRDSWGPR